MAFFSLEFWQAIVATVLGAGLGVPLALWIDRLLQRRRVVAERCELEAATAEALRQNQDLLTQLGERFKDQDWVPDLVPDLTLLDATAHRRYELSTTLENSRLVDRARYELHRLELRLSLVRGSVATAETSALVRRRFKSIRDDLQYYIPHVKQAISDALAALERATVAKR